MDTIKSLLQFSFAFVCLILLGFSEHSTAASTVYFGILPTSVKVNFKAINQKFDLLFYVVNNSTQKQTLSDLTFIPIKAPAANPVKLVSIGNDCKNILAGQGSVCNIHVIMLAQGNKATTKSYAPFDYQFSMKINAVGGRGSVLSAKIPTRFLFATGKVIAEATRTIAFENLCPASQKVYMGISGGAVNSIRPAIAGKLTTCTTSADCYPGSTCVNTNPKQCFSDNPIPKNTVNPANPYYLAPKKTSSVTIPTYDNGVQIIWSGGIAARLECTGDQCQTADCGGVAADKVHGCVAGRGFNQPVTTSEFTLEGEGSVTSATFNGSTYVESGNTAADTYDVTIINGITMAPLSMQPSNAGWSAANPYYCGIPGFKPARSPLGACSWNFTPPTVGYVWVAFKTGAISCTQDSDCTTKPEVCGQSYNPGVAPGLRIRQHCGIKKGYWTADAICAADPKNNTPEFPCTTEVQGSLTYGDLFGCSTGNLAQSCYNVSTTTCCGCVNWDTVANVSVPYPPTAKCVGANPIWQTHSQPRLEWLKRGCPTAYTYPYDDKSSTFTCQKFNKEKINTTNYLIRFCPENI